jgi:hypothetical protein
MDTDEHGFLKTDYWIRRAKYLDFSVIHQSIFIRVHLCPSVVEIQM